MIELEALNSVPDFYGERNQKLFAEAYNTFREDYWLVWRRGERQHPRRREMF